MAQYVSYATSLHRLTAALGSILGLVGLLLTSIGVYGVITYRANRRAKEIGIRMALGADNRQILRLVMSDGFVLCLLGIVAGLPLAFEATKLVASMLIGIDPWDAPSILTGVGLVLLSVGLATVIPARRATLVRVSDLLRSASH